MIYESRLNNAIVDSMFTSTSTIISRMNCALVTYSGTMPTHDEFVNNWSSSYYVTRANDPNAGVSSSHGTTVLTVHGTFYEAFSLQPIVLQVTNNEIYYDTTQVASSHRLGSGTIGFCMLMPGATNYSLNSSTDMGGRPFFLLDVSDPQGSGIVKFSTLDATSAAPTLSSIEFEVNMT